MRVLILHFLTGNNKKHTEILKKLEQVAIANGHDVTVCNDKDAINLHMAMFEYIAVLTAASSFIGAKLPSKLPEILSSHGILAGKKGCALVAKYGLSSAKMCRITMRAMEKEGMVLDYFEVIENVGHAAYVGKKIG